MDMTDAQRAELGRLVRAQRTQQFGTKSAAYQRAGINPATWERIETGQTVREDRLLAAVRTLWPASGGDWQKIGAPSPPEGHTVEQRLTDLEDRIGALERAIETTEESDGSGIRAAPTKPAVSATAKKKPRASRATTSGARKAPRTSASRQPSADPRGIDLP